MLCAACGHSEYDSAILCSACGEDPRLDTRYRLIEVVGQGAVGTTYRAARLPDGAIFAVKELLVRRLDSFKTEELFRREAEALRTLQHPGIPRYVEEFVSGQGKQLGLYLVQEFVDGVTLGAEATQRRYDEPAVLGILAELADILAYLHGLRPPVIHRDLKLGNVMRRAADGRLMLIDFGSVRAVVEDQAAGGSTVAGTFGYMAPEQFSGHASPASDLYALGVTGAVLLSRREPHELLDTTNELCWQEAVAASPAVEGLLAELLERDPDDRAHDASEVAVRLRALQAGQPDPSPRGSASAGRPERGAVGHGAAVVALQPPRAPGTPARAGARSSSLVWADPPPAPRPVSFTTLRHQKPGASFGLLFGSIFGGVGGGLGLTFLILGFVIGLPLFALIGGLFTLLFGGIGGAFFVSGVRTLTRARRLWQRGATTQGELLGASLDGSLRVNGRNPVALEYAYTVDGRRYSGSSRSWQRHMVQAPAGAPVSVLYDPNQPAESLLYLP